MDKQLQKRKEREEKQLVKDQRAVKKTNQETVSEKKAVKENTLSLVHQFSEMQLSSDDDSSEAENTICPKCGLVYADSQGLWICCDGCNQWFDIECTNIKKRKVPELYYCEDCVS